MVTFAQAQERAEEWVNGDVPSYQHREVRVREFELGFVVWAEDRAEGPRSDGGAQRLVLARDSGEATLWPALPVGEVIRRYEEQYGRAASVEDAVPAPPARVDLNQTSFLLTPPEWLQEAADKLGIPDRRAASGSGTSGGGAASAAPPAPRFPWPLRAGGRWTRCRLRVPRRGPGPTRRVWTRARTVPCRCRRPCSRRNWVTRTAMTFRVPGTPSTAVQVLPELRGLRGTGIRRGPVAPRTGTRRVRPVCPTLRGVRSRPTRVRSRTRRPARHRRRAVPGARAPRLPGCAGNSGRTSGSCAALPAAGSWPGSWSCGWICAYAVRVGAGGRWA